jgi:hypothetical protein
MRRKFRVRLTRRVGKKLRSIDVIVQQVTLGGFIEALRVAGTWVMKLRDQVKKGQDLTERDVMLFLLHPEVCKGVADVLCPEMPRGWYEDWHSEANVKRMLEAARKTSDWSRLLAQLDFSGNKRGGKGSLYGDAILLGRIIGVNPLEILDVWPMERFLDMVEGVIRDKEVAEEEELREDPTMDPEAKPTPLIPGLGKQWTH